MNNWYGGNETIGAFTLAGISGIQISVFASRSKSWDFYKCGHKNLTNYRDQHHAANRNTSCDYLGINAIICIAADVWTLEQIILVFSIPSFQASVSKQGQCLISGMRSSVTRIIPLGDQQDVSACLNKRKISQYFNRDGNLDLSCVWMHLMRHQYQSRSQLMTCNQQTSVVSCMLSMHHRSVTQTGNCNIQKPCKFRFLFLLDMSQVKVYSPNTHINIWGFCELKYEFLAWIIQFCYMYTYMYNWHVAQLFILNETSPSENINENTWGKRAL